MTYLSEVLADSPVHYWRLADPGGYLCHDIGSTVLHVHSDLVESASYSGPNSDGGSVFHNTTSSILLNENDLVLGTSFSLEAWEWRFETGAYGVLGLGNAGAGCAMRYPDTSHVQAYITASPSPAATAVLSPTFQKWHHWVATYDHATLRLYFDGALVASAAAVVTPTTPLSIFIGGDRDNSAKYLGFLSEVAVYGTTLSAARVLAHYNAADQPLQAPVFASAGSFSLSSGAQTPPATLSDLIYNAVHKIY